MNNYKINIRFEGSKFYPSKLVANINLPFRVLAEYGAPALKGRHKDMPSPYGMAVIELPLKESRIEQIIEKCVANLELWSGYLYESGVDNTIIDIGYFEEYPVDISFSKELMNRLVHLNAAVEFHPVSKEEKIAHGSKTIAAVLNSLKKGNELSSIISKLKDENILYNDAALSTLLYFYFSPNHSGAIEEDLKNINKIMETAL